MSRTKRFKVDTHKEMAEVFKRKSGAHFKSRVRDKQKWIKEFYDEADGEIKEFRDKINDVFLGEDENDYL